MRRFLYYSIILLSFIAVVVFYFLKTASGHRNIGYFIEDYLSNKTYNKIKVHSLNLENYPHIVIKLQINSTANISLKGEVSNHDINMKYHLTGDSFKFNDLHLKDKIDINGTLFGAFSSLLVTGEGSVFDGEAKYRFVNIPHTLKDMSIEMKSVNLVKILSFLDEEAYIKGVANIDAEFKTFSKYEKDGKAKIYMQKAFIPLLTKKMPFVLNSTIDFQEVEYHYEVDMHSDIGKISLKDGEYHEGKKIAKGKYEIYLKDLLFLKKMLNYTYEGSLDTNGTVEYDNSTGVVVVKGQTEQFGGGLYYLYSKNNLDVKFREVSLAKLSHHFSFPLFFSSTIYGVAKFNMKEKRVIVNIDLKKTSFNKSKLSDILYDKLNIDILENVYDKSYFSGGYQHSLFSSTLKINNGKEYIYLMDSELDVGNDKIHSKLEIKMQGQELFGEIHGTLKNPKVWIDKNRYIQHQTDKHLGNWLGTN
ncbi:MAG: hypothetical protein KAG56_08085 [Sulfurovaceae bacterium]|nr:hypothetical protein [Sulfurovaceae bacterium]